MYKFLLPLLCFTSFSFAEETPDVSKISEAFGHLIGKNLHSMGIRFDIAKVKQGLEDSEAGKLAPMTETEFVEAVTSIHEVAFKETAIENLKKSEEFLAKNEEAPGVKTLEKGKLQYRVEKEGTGPLIDKHNTPLIHYLGKFLDGTPFGSATEEERISFEEYDLIPGLEKTLLDMKEGEKRTVFVHPELGFGMHDHNIPPNSLLTLEIEVIKANAPAEKPMDSLTTGNPEIAHPFEDQKTLR